GSVRREKETGPKTSIICSPMTSLKTSIKTITYLSDTGCLEIQGASLLLCKQPERVVLEYLLHVWLKFPPLP
ncbi:hypothetical protein ACKWMI_24685, partial [Escherichia coli]|uniref:hypothetical protein n=1 Tax=Escherichia coli TaxID=562 RepID=UPI0039048F4A